MNVSRQGIGKITRLSRTGKEVSLSTAELEKIAIKLAKQLGDAGARAGDCVLLVNRDPLAFACGFWACQAAGLTAVPMPHMGTAVQVERTRAAISVLGRAWVVTEDPDCQEVLADVEEVAGAFVISGERFDHLEGNIPNDADPSLIGYTPDPDAISVIMFSSGSTGDPKGVELSHRAIVAQTAILQGTLSVTADDCFVNWMPMSHDFGLFHFHILPMLSGLPQVLMVTDDFARLPLSWLRALDDHGGTITGGPNMALQMVSKLLKPERAAQFDLTGLRSIVLGAEPLDPVVLRDFVDRLADTGLTPASLWPAYGLAEATLVISMRSGLDTVHVARRALEPGQRVDLLISDDPEGVELPLLGLPANGIEMRIVDCDMTPLTPGTVGHVQVRSPAMMRGYRNSPDQSTEALQPDGWLATGDIGFMHNGEFVIVGRAKDVIISGGRNYHPADLERIAEATPSLSPIHQIAITQGRDPAGGGEKTFAFLRARGRTEDAEGLRWAITAHVLARTGVALDHVFLVRDLPRTTSGKLQRHALARAIEQGDYDDQLSRDAAAAATGGAPLRRAVAEGHVAAVAEGICQEAAQLCGAAIDPAIGLMDQGMSSRQAMALCARLGTWLGQEISIGRLFDHPTPRGLADALIRSTSASGTEAVTLPLIRQVDEDARIAVIGYGCRFPGGDTPEEFWDFLTNPRPVVTQVPADRWAQGPECAALPPAALLSNIDSFDAAHFGLARGEAEAMNPVQRLLLQVLWQALEHAGLDAAQLRGQRVGLFVGLSESGLATGRGEIIADGDALAPYAVSGSAGSIAVGRMAHVFDFRGPALAVDTACSSSIVALDLAAQALRQGRCDLAIAGAANLILSRDLHAGLHKMGALSPDGLCKTFDAAADGYGRGEGAGLVVLKRMADAHKDRDSVRAEILATTLNHDGQSASVTAPNGNAQRDLLRRALQEAGLGGGDLDWVETHGTGTALGDPIELEALKDVLRGKPGRPLPIGALKSRIGHLEAAAGIASLIKVLLALEKGSVPADRLCSQWNDRFDWESGELKPVTQGLDWSSSGPRLAGIASFGMSGTNAYAIVASPPVKPAEPAAQGHPRPAVLPLSAQTEAAAPLLQGAWMAHLEGKEPAGRFSLAAGQACRRATGPWRKALLLPAEGSLAEAVCGPWIKAKTAPRLIFVYPGQGAQLAAMGAELYQSEPVFRAAFDVASKAAGQIQGQSLAEWLYSAGLADQTRINQTDLSQPALVAFGYALAALWAELGVRPDAVLGHSVGEIGAAVTSGQLDIETAMQLAVRRGRLMQSSAGEGAMLALRADEDAARNLTRGLQDTVIAGYNGPKALTLAGPVEEISELRSRAELADYITAPLQVTRAFHSPAMAQAAQELLGGLDLQTAQGLLPVFSTLTGALAPADVFGSAQYWHDQMLQPVRFLQAVQAASASGDAIFLEMGPGAGLSRLGGAAAPDAIWIGGANTQEAVASVVGRAWSHGAHVDWEKYYGMRGAYGDQLPRHPMVDQVMPRRQVASATPPKMPAIASVAMPAITAAVPNDVLETEILPIVARISGVAVAQISADASLTALGLDSLGMVQLQRALSTRLDLKVELRDLFETFETPRKLADLLAKSRPAPVAAAAEQGQGVDVISKPDTMASVMRAQLKMVEDVIARQLQVMTGGAAVAPDKPASVPAVARPVGAEIKGLFRQPKTDASDLSAAQQAHVADLSAQWNRRSAGSKAGAASARKHVANGRSVFGFAPDLKELTYPLLVNRAEGAYVWDVDDNRYIDVTMGFGVYLFGHKPDFINKALHNELDQGAAIGPATPLAEQVAERIHRLTGAERSAFFSTGTEAIMCAVRIARAVTGRQRIVIFKGAYHGSFDGVLATGWVDEDGTPQAAPMTDGTLQGMVDPVITLDYGDMAGLDVIARHADDIALVLVEPVQSRNPENRPLEFLRALRALTRAHDVPLLFDEVISGFRFAAGGMQEIFGIEADLVTYGKVLGHGQPIGVLSGKARFMDAVDGGAWSYGDDSIPGTRTAFVAGTFNGHPMALTAARCVLDHIIADDGSFFEQLAERTEKMCQRLDTLFLAEGVPVHMERFGSLFRFNFGPGAEILNTHLLNNGVFVWEQRNCFLSTAHGDIEVDQIVEATRAGVAALKAAGWFGGRAPAPSAFAGGAGSVALRHHAGSVRRGTWTDLVMLRLGELRYAPEAVAHAWAQVCKHHLALRACPAPDGMRRVGDAAAGSFENCILNIEQGGLDAALDSWASHALTHVFAFDRAPIRLSLLDGGEQVMALTSSHLGFDGWSLALILSDLAKCLDGETLDPADAPDQYHLWEKDVEFHRLDAPITSLDLPADGFEPDAVAPNGARITRTDIAPLYEAMARAVRGAGITPLAGFMAPYVALLGWLSGQDRITVGVPVAGQALSGCLNLAGNVSFVRPVSVDISPGMSLAELGRRLHSEIMRPGARPPLVSMPARHALFNLDGPIDLGVGMAAAVLHPAPIAGARSDLFLNLLRIGNHVILDFDWNSDRFSTRTAQRWLDAYLIAATRLTTADLTVAEAFELFQEIVPDHRPTTSKPQDPLTYPVSSGGPRHADRPLTDTEQSLAKIWEELLGVPVSTPFADFFDLGGGSLQAVRLQGRLSAQLGCRLGLEAIFAKSQLVEMAVALTDSAHETGPIQQAFVPQDGGRVPALPQQQQLHLLEAVSEAGAAYNICLRLDFSHSLSENTLNLAMGQLARRHASLRTTFAWGEERLEQIIASAPAEGLAAERLYATAIPDEVLDAFAQRPFEQEGALFWRVGLMDVEDGGSVLVLALHHIISDAWSVEVMVGDLLDAYQRVALSAEPLPMLARDFPDHAGWVHGAQAIRAEALAFWKDKAADAPALTVLAGDRPRPSEKSFAGARVSRQMPDDLLRRVQHCARARRTTPFQMILAAIATYAGAELGRSNLVIGTVSAGRSQSGMDKVIGLFANTLPLCLNLTANQSWSDRIADVSAELLAAAAHDLISLQEIGVALGLEPDQSANPLFEICVTHDDRRALSQLGAELGFEFAEMTLPTTQFDLSFYVIETGRGLALDVTFATAIHSDARVEALVGCIFEALEHICNNPDGPAGGGIVPLKPRSIPAITTGSDSASLLSQIPELTALQKRLWFVDRFENGVLYDAAPTYYNMAAQYKLDSEVDAVHLTQRLSELYRQVPGLAHAFDMQADEPRIRAAQLGAPVCAELRPEAVDAFVDAPFDLSEGALLRVGRVSSADGMARMVLVAHHIITDPRRLDLLAAALLHGEVSPELTAPNVAPAVSDTRSSEDLAFWRDTLGTNPPRLLLPVDKTRAAVHVFGRGRTSVCLSAQACSALDAFVGQRDLQFDDAVLAGFVALLHRLSGQDSVVLGQTCPRAGTGLAAHDNLVTLNIPVRPDCTTDDMISEIAQTARLAEMHGQTDFDAVVLDLRPENDMSRTALFDILMVRNDADIASRITPAASGWGKYDLVLASLRRPDGGLELDLTFNTCMFDHETIAHWGDMLVHLLEEIPQKGEQPFDLLPLMPDAQVAPLIAVTAPRRGFEGIPFMSIPEALAAASNSHPEATALRDEKGTINYRALVGDGAALAHRLMGVGVQRGDRVAILLPRGAAYVRAMLAVMQAGATFVPLDLDAPRDRLAAILEDADMRCVLLSEGIGADLLPPDVSIIDISAPYLIEGPHPKLPDLKGDDAAYVIFTSGSTGRPKGVVVEHRNVLSLVLGQGDIYPIAPKDRWSWFHSAAFDFSIWEIWGALLSGGEVILVPETARKDMAAFRSVLAQNSVTHLSITPSAFRALSDFELSEPHDDDLALRAVWFGGEALTPTVLQPWQNKYPDCQLINLFGITETTVHTTFHRLSKADLCRSDSPIGAPLPSYGVTIRDRNLRPVPNGVQGEIVVSGTGVARGYLGQPAQTAARFVNDPHNFGSRLYRSGDLGRMGANGEVTYLGRSDDQVKLRGYRIELGEVESGLCSFTGVRAAAAGLLGDSGSAAILAVWVVLESAVDPEALDRHLAAVLPAYMIPRRIFVVDQLPLTQNGKIDRKVLRGSTDRLLGAEGDAAPPRPGLETQIAEILCALLGLTEIRRADSFFALGGHSLMANKAVLRMRAQLGMTISLRDFFSTPSVAGLAAIESSSTVETTAAIEPVPDAESYPLSSAQTRLYAMQTAQPKSAAYNMVGGFIIDGPVDKKALAEAFGDIVDRHEILRTRFVQRAGVPVQIVDPSGAGVDIYELPTCEGDTETRVAHALDPEFSHVFDLSQGPLLRVGLGPLTAEQWLLVLNLHHIISDGWSVPIMLADLSRFYAARLGSSTRQPEALRIQYRDFACWQSDQPAKEAVEAALAHWSHRLSNAETVVSLPTDALRGAQRSGRGQMARYQLDADTSAALRARLADVSATLFSACAATLHILLRLRGESSGPTVIGTADAGRNAIETEDQLGFYLNILPHVLNLDLSVPLIDWLRSSTDETGAMLSHKTVPFERMLDALEIRPEPGHNPVFDILLLVQNNAATTGTLGPLGLRALPDQTRTARYDLNLMVEDRPEIELVLEYDTALFDSVTIDWFLSDFARLLEGVISTPDLSPLRMLESLNGEEEDGFQGMLDADDPLFGGL